MSAKNPAAAFRAAGMAWKGTTTPLRSQARSFSYFPQLQAVHAISFPQTSNSDLDKTLADIRQHIILPSYLSEEQRKQLYSIKHKDRLESDPITMEIDGEVLRFRHIDMFTLPSARKLLRAAVDQMETEEDFRLLPKVFEGLFVHAGRRPPKLDMVAIVRKLHRNGYLNIVLECVAASKRTGFRLANSELINELLTTVQKEAIDTGFEKEKTEKMLAWTERVVEKLEDPASKPSSRERLQWTQGYPFYRDPQILAARLHLAAALVVRHHDGKDVDGKVARYAEDLARLWRDGVGLLGLHEETAYNDKKRMRYLRHPNQFLWYASPILNGINGAIPTVRDPWVSTKLRAISAKLTEEVQQALAKALETGSKPQDGAENWAGRGVQLYYQLFPDGAPEAKQEVAEEI